MLTVTISHQRLSLRTEN